MDMQITFKNVTADYMIGPMRTPDVLQSINLTIEPGSFTAIVGHTGAGKTSLLKAMNGLLIPTKGHVKVGKYTITSKTHQQTLKMIRKKVGVVFQFPESQLFAKTVGEDICFGPLNFGIPLKEAKIIAKKMLKLVGLEQSILEKSPFSLSGGQKRRVAIAGVLATNPKVLILDEPGAGLDPDSKKEIFSLLATLNKEQRKTIILVTHDMDDVAMYANDVIVMEKGRIAMHTTVRDFFSNPQKLASWDLDIPTALRFQLKVERAAGIKMPRTCLTVEELARAMMEVGLV